MLAVATWLAHRLARGALAPVELMRIRAAAITESDLTERLPLPDSQGEIARLGRTFNTLLDRLAGAFQRERRIVSDASHELRTPLAVLSAELQVASRPDRTPEQLRETVASALDETRRLTRLADDLLVLARSDEGRLPLRREPLDTHDVLRDLERRNASAYAAGGRTLVLREEVEGGAVVLADADRLAQALDNLIANALRHGRAPVEVAAQQCGATIEITVRDSGPGVAADIQPRLFQRFATGTKRGGTGLGLFIVRELARAHGGDAWYRPIDGGSEFVLSLPTPSMP
jgi:signal transduction histidine kinase